MESEGERKLLSCVAQAKGRISGKILFANHRNGQLTPTAVTHVPPTARSALLPYQSISGHISATKPAAAARPRAMPAQVISRESIFRTGIGADRQRRGSPCGKR